MWFRSKKKEKGDRTVRDQPGALMENQMESHWMNESLPHSPAGLPKNHAPSPSFLRHVRMVYWSDTGRVRQVNEDSFYFAEEVLKSRINTQTIAMAMVADGMGGLDQGDEASYMAASRFSNYIKAYLYPYFMIRSEGAPYSPEWIREVLMNGLHEMNQSIYNYFQERGSRSGTTLSLVLMTEAEGYVVHVGDSRIYLIEPIEKRIRQITTDHSYVGMLLSMGELSEEEARNHPRKNEIYRMIGYEKDVEADFFHFPLSEQQYLLLCSDGLVDLVRDEEILSIAVESRTMQEVVDRLGSLANERGGYDNTTILYLQMMMD